MSQDDDTLSSVQAGDLLASLATVSFSIETILTNNKLILPFFAPPSTSRDAGICDGHIHLH
jgi:hypothetical protein